MLRSAVFGRAAGYVGILAGVVGLGFYLPTVGLFLSILSVVLIAIWNVMVGRGLFHLGQVGSRKERS